MMNWIGPAIVLGALLLVIFFLRLGVRLDYDRAGVRVDLRLGFHSFRLYPRETDPVKAAKKREKQARKQKKKKEKQSGRGIQPQEPDKRAMLALIKPMLPVLERAAGKFRRKLQVDELSLRLIWGEEDPADAAMHYGYAWAMAASVVAFIESLFTVKKKQIDITLDYQRDKPQLQLRAGLSLTPAQLIWIGLPVGVSGLKLMKSKRGEADTKGEQNNGKQSPS